MRKRKDYVVLIVDRRTDTRRQLKEYYFGYLKLSYAGYAKSRVYMAKGIADAMNKVNACLDVNLIIFSLNFPDEDKLPLRDLLNSFQMAVTFVSVPLGPFTKEI